MSITATLFGQMITFGLLVWFTMNFVWPPLMQALEERKKKIADGLAAGEKGKHELELADKKAKSFLKEAKDQAADIVNLAQKRANDLADEKHIQEGIDYFSVGVVAYDMNITKNIPKIKDILKDYVSSNVVEAIIDANESHALHEFHFHLYRNFS